MNEIQKLQLSMLRELDEIASKHGIPYYLAYGTALGAIREKGFIPWDSDVDVYVKYNDYEFLCEKLKKELSEDYSVVWYRYDQRYDSLKARICPVGVEHHDVHIDLFPLVGAPSEKSEQKRFVKITYLVYRLFYAKQLDSFQLYRAQRMKLLVSLLVKVPLLFVPSELLIRLHENLCTKYPVDESEFFHNPCGSYGIREILPRTFIGSGKRVSFEGVDLLAPQLLHEYVSHIYGPDYLTPKRNNYI